VLELISNKKHQNTLVRAIELAYKDFLNSEYSHLRASLLDDFFLKHDLVSKELFKAVLITGEVNIDFLEDLFIQMTYGDKNIKVGQIKDAISYVVTRIRLHAAENEPQFRDYYQIYLAEEEVGLSKKQVELQKQIVDLLTKQNSNEEISIEQKELQRGIYIPSPRCRNMWGRDLFISEIIRKMDFPTANILAISGGAGYGKTEVARQIASEILDKNAFTDVIWVTARQAEFIAGFDNLAEDDEQLELEGFQTEIANQLSCLYSDVPRRLRTDKYLIVLDNAETANLSKILPYLSKWLNPSKALITSRISTVEPFVEDVSIPGLSFEAALDLIKDEARFHSVSVLSKARAKELRKIYDLSCGAPLALHFIISRARNDNSLHPVLVDLEQANKDVSNFYQFCFSAAWHKIGENSKTILRYLGHLSKTSVALNDLYIASDMEKNDLQKAIGELQRWHLVDLSSSKLKGTGRLDLHPWVRSCIQNNLVDKWNPNKDIIAKTIQQKLRNLTNDAN